LIPDFLHHVLHDLPNFLRESLIPVMLEDDVCYTQGLFQCCKRLVSIAVHKFVYMVDILSDISKLQTLLSECFELEVVCQWSVISVDIKGEDVRLSPDVEVDLFYKELVLSRGRNISLIVVVSGERLDQDLVVQIDVKVSDEPKLVDLRDVFVALVLHPL